MIRHIYENYFKIYRFFCPFFAALKKLYHRKFYKSRIFIEFSIKYKHGV